MRLSADAKNSSEKARIWEPRGREMRSKRVEVVSSVEGLGKARRRNEGF